MDKLELKDRIVVEFLAPKNEQRFTPDFIASQLRAIAQAIEEGMSGDNYTPWPGNEVLWEHESVGYGGFRIVSGKSLICQYYYHSEAQPLLITEDNHLYIVPKDFANFYIEDTQQWACTHEAAIFTKEQAEALVESERKKYNLTGLAGPYVVKLTPIQKHLVE